jgi:hypothetical protein
VGSDLADRRAAGGIGNHADDPGDLSGTADAAFTLAAPPALVVFVAGKLFGAAQNKSRRPPISDSRVTPTMRSRCTSRLATASKLCRRGRRWWCGANR